MISVKCYGFAYQDFYQAAHKHYSIVWWIIVHGFRAGWLRGGWVESKQVEGGWVEGRWFEREIIIHLETAPQTTLVIYEIWL